MAVFDKIVSVLESIIKALVGLFVLTLSVMTFLQVILRYVFKTGLVFNDEFCRTLFVFIIFLILPYASLHNMHMQLDIISGKVEKAKPILRSVAWIVEFTFFSFMIVNGYGYALANLKKIASSLQISYYYIYMIIPIACALGDIFLIYRLAKVLQAKKKGVSWLEAYESCMAEEDLERDED